MKPVKNKLYISKEKMQTIRQDEVGKLVKAERTTRKQVIRKLLFAAHLDAFSFGYCQMLSNKIQKQCGDAYQPDRYPILPCTGCSGLLSNLNIINDLIQSDGLQQDSLFEQWLSEWMYKFSIMLFDLKFYLKGNNQ